MTSVTLDPPMKVYACIAATIALLLAMMAVHRVSQLEDTQRDNVATQNRLFTNQALFSKCLALSATSCNLSDQRIDLVVTNLARHERAITAVCWWVYNEEMGKTRAEEWR